MKISAINLNNTQIYQSIKSNKQANNKEVTISEYTPCPNSYFIPFTGSYNMKNNLPDKLKINCIEECNPVPDDGFDTERLTGILSTAMKYIKEDTPIVLGCSDRRESQNFIFRTFSNEDLFQEKKEINNIIFVEDDRIIDEPVMFIKEKNKIYIIADTQIINKEGKTLSYTNSMEKKAFSLAKNSIKLFKTDIDSISAGELPDKRDLQFIKMFKADDVMDLDFRNTGEIQSGEFTALPPKNAKFKSTIYPMFNDIGGNKEAIQRVIEDIYAPMIYPELFGHIMTKGSILEGPPGTGKSMLGKALCNELSKRLGQKVDLQEISGAEMQIPAVGGSEGKWRALFETAIDNQPALILIDEIDACTPKRDGSSNARFDNSVVNQILSLMSNLEKSDHQVHVIGMTNRLEAIDPAMLRKGRFGNIIPMPAPNYNEADEIFEKIAANYNFDETFDKDKMLNRIIKIKGTGATIAGALEQAQKYARRNHGIYGYALSGTLTQKDMNNCLISMENINKALDDEEEKLKKAKISSDRIVIKGFRQ